MNKEYWQINSIKEVNRRMLLEEVNIVQTMTSLKQIRIT